MTIYALGNSVLHSKKFMPRYADILKLTPITSYHNTRLNTIIGVYHDSKNLNLAPGDKILFNIGVNDLLQRPGNHHRMFSQYAAAAQANNDPESYFYYHRAAEKFRTKQPKELVRLIEPGEFDALCDKTFARFAGRGVVLSVNYFTAKTHKYWVKDVLTVNASLRSFAWKHKLVFLNMWLPEVEKYLYDGVHFTKAGHAYAANRIAGALALVGTVGKKR